MSTSSQLTDWYLVRHAPVKDNTGSLYHHHDPASILPPEYAATAMTTELPKNAMWYVSTLARTRTTAEALLSALPAFKAPSRKNVHYTKYLKEQDFGVWQGLTFDRLWSEIKDHAPHNWSLMAAQTTPPDGESFLDVIARVSGVVDHLTKLEPNRPKVLVTHAGVIRAFVADAMNMNPDQALSLTVDPFSVTCLTHQAKGVTYENDNTKGGLGGNWQLKYLNRVFA